MSIPPSCGLPIPPPLLPSVGVCLPHTLTYPYGSRTYTICIPPSYDPQSSLPLPLVFNFHGWGGSPSSDLYDSQLWEYLDDEFTDDFVLVHPEGYDDGAGEVE